MSTVNVLSIDAWSDGEDGWFWNMWHKVGSVDLDDVPISDGGKLQWFVSQGYVIERGAFGWWVIDWDYEGDDRTVNAGAPFRTLHAAQSFVLSLLS